MAQISEHFQRIEFACKCGCGFDAVDHVLLFVLEDVRAHFGVPVIISSGCRCEKYNRAIGGAEKSQHKFAKATDIILPGVEAGKVADYLEKKYRGKFGIGRYPKKTGRETEWTHIDVRRIAARWVK